MEKLPRQLSEISLSTKIINENNLEIINKLFLKI